MQLGETIATYDVALALRGESGKFDVTSPTGDIYHITCRPDHSISSLEWSGNQTNPQPFMIRKVAEPVPQDQGKAVDASEGGPQMRPGRAPFLMENQDGDAKSSSQGVMRMPKIVEDELKNSEVACLDLHVECDAKTKLPTASVCLKSVQDSIGTLLTSPCTTFNDFDAEIRRLHGQLDDIRYRARKKFYQAKEALAAGA